MRTRRSPGRAGARTRRGGRPERDDGRAGPTTLSQSAVHPRVGQESNSTRRSTWSFCPTSCRTPRSRHVVRPCPRPLPHRYAGDHQLIQPCLRPLIRIAETARREASKPIRNWVNASDVRNLLDVTGLETITETGGSCSRSTCRGWRSPRTVCLRTSGPSTTSRVTGGSSLAHGRSPAERRPCRSSSPAATSAETCGLSSERAPQMGTATELVFVEGGTRDGTREEIEAVVSEPQADADPARRADGERQGRRRPERLRRCEKRGADDPRR